MTSVYVEPSLSNVNVPSCFDMYSCAIYNPIPEFISIDVSFVVKRFFVRRLNDSLGIPVPKSRIFIIAVLSSLLVFIDRTMRACFIGLFFLKQASIPFVIIFVIASSRRFGLPSMLIGF